MMTIELSSTILLNHIVLLSDCLSCVFEFTIHAFASKVDLIIVITCLITIEETIIDKLELTVDFLNCLCYFTNFVNSYFPFITVEISIDGTNIF